MKERFAKYFALALLALIPSLLPAQQKHALVIGNGAYTSITALKNPVNDARDMGAVLAGLGFTVDLVLDGTRKQMEDAGIRLKERLSAAKDSYGFLFYAGHGVQYSGENYLIPVDANIQSGNYLKDRAVSVQALLDELNDAGNKLNIVVLDACRNNPFGWSRSGNRGLVVVSGQPAGSIIVYATSANSVAADGDRNNGLFTECLLNRLKTPGLEVKDVFNLTGADVSSASNQEQIPAIYIQFFGTVYLGALPEGFVMPEIVPAPVPAAPPALAAVPTTPPPIRLTPTSMVLIDGGTFNMGSTGGASNETPVHSVTVRSFYMAKYQVTQREWQEVMGYNPSHFKGENLPVENVSWQDAVEYCNTRSVRDGLTPAYRGSGDSVTCDWNANGYRLPTEAEWEYVAKGGNGTPGHFIFAGSNFIEPVAWYKNNSGRTTHPVGAKNPNGLGVHDLNGNVWEWCWDRYGSYSRGAQTDPQGASSGSSRVCHGGSWNYAAASTAARLACSPSYRDSEVGFRVVRR